MDIVLFNTIMLNILTCQTHFSIYIEARMCQMGKQLKCYYKTCL